MDVSSVHACRNWGEGPPKCSGSGLRTPQNTSTSDSPSRGIKHSAAERFPFSAEKIALSPPLQVVSLPFAESLIPRAHWPEPQRAGELLHLPRAPRAPRVARARADSQRPNHPEIGAFHCHSKQGENERSSRRRKQSVCRLVARTHHGYCTRTCWRLELA